MRINIFEGARRIALIVGVLWVVGGIAYAVLEEPYASAPYVISSLGEKPVPALRCGDNDAQAYPDPTMPWGEKLSVGVVLCFSAHRADNGAYLVPYAPAGEGKVWLGEKYSSEVTRYTKEVAENFVFTDEVLKAASKVKRAARIEQWRNALIFIVAGLAVGWLLIAAIGWIVRGFLGIPRGQDALAQQSKDISMP